MLLDVVGAERIGLVEDDDLRLVDQFLAIGGELGPDGLVGGSGIAAGAVDKMQQDAAALDMAEKTVAEADAFMCALDQAGKIGDTNSRPSTLTTPSCGCSVVNG